MCARSTCSSEPCSRSEPALAVALALGKVYRPTGPELLSPNDIAAVMGKVLGRKVKYQDISESVLLKALRVEGLPEAMPTQLALYADEYRRGAFAIHAPSNVVRELTGREPEDFETIARRIVATRPEAVRTLGKKLRDIRPGQPGLA